MSDSDLNGPSESPDRGTGEGNSDYTSDSDDSDSSSSSGTNSSSDVATKHASWFVVLVWYQSVS